MTDLPHLDYSRARWVCEQHADQDWADPHLATGCAGPGMPMVPTLINERWELLLPEHRAVRPEWPHWERERLASMHANLKPGMVVYDIGAEEGDLPGLWASWGCAVVLFEPNPLVWPNARAVFEANGLAPAGCWPGFAADVTADAPEADRELLAIRDGWPVSAYGDVIGDHGFRQLNERPHDTPRVRIDDVPAVLDVPAPTAITIDVEGSELSVLHGAERTMRDVRPLVWVSVHPTFMREQYGVDAEDLFAFMAGLGYRRTHLASDHEEHEFFHHPDAHDPVLK